MINRRRFLEGTLGLVSSISLPSLSLARTSPTDFELTAGPVSGMLYRTDGAASDLWGYNGQLPGPELRVRKGDRIRVRFKNDLDEPTSIHWHGLLVPPNMDGVPYLSFPPIQPETTFVYEFPIRQSGTYWYHSHSNLQEQSGVYGAIVIEPKQEHPHKKVDDDHVILFSDWTSEDPHQVLRSLKRGSEWYAIEKGSGQSIIGAARMRKLGEYIKREIRRMPPTGP